VLRIISHRGNLSGPKSVTENSPLAIDDAILRGFEVEVDIRYSEETESFFLGHDYPEFEISLEWLAERELKLWVHCKNTDALKQLRKIRSSLNYFFHDQDVCTLTSHGFPWVHPDTTPFSDGVFVLPELKNLYSPTVLSVMNLAGICTDFPYRYLQNVE
jgi:hypothetical protein